MSVMTFETNQQMLVNKIESVDGQGYNNNKGTVANIINQVFLISVSLLLVSVISISCNEGRDGAG